MQTWIDWVKQIKAISQIGKTYTKDPYDLERYEQLQALAHQMIARIAEAPIERVDQFFVPDKGYATPKVDLRAGVFKDDKILLVQERSDEQWTLPGGWADVCESPQAGIAREVYEEAGYEVKPVKLVAVIDRACHPYKPVYPNHIYKLLFLCDLVGGTPKENLEVLDIKFFNIDALPPLSESRTLPQDIDTMYRHHQQKDLPAYFD